MTYRLMRLFVITISEGLHDCVLCGRWLGSSGWFRLVSELIALVEAGMLSLDGIKLLAHLRRLPCKLCLARILGENLLTSCAVSTDSEPTNGGTYSTRTSSRPGINEWYVDWQRRAMQIGRENRLDG
jgi:hypothetical protein